LRAQNTDTKILAMYCMLIISKTHAHFTTVVIHFALFLFNNIILFRAYLQNRFSFIKLLFRK